MSYYETAFLVQMLLRIGGFSGPDISSGFGRQQSLNVRCSLLGIYWVCALKQWADALEGSKVGKPICFFLASGYLRLPISLGLLWMPRALRTSWGRRQSSLYSGYRSTGCQLVLEGYDRVRWVYLAVVSGYKIDSYHSAMIGEHHNY